MVIAPECGNRFFRVVEAATSKSGRSSLMFIDVRNRKLEQHAVVNPRGDGCSGGIDRASIHSDSRAMLPLTDTRQCLSRSCGKIGRHIDVRIESGASRNSQSSICQITRFRMTFERGS